MSDIETLIAENQPLVIGGLVVVGLYFALLFGLIAHVQLNKGAERKKREKHLRRKAEQRERQRHQCTWFVFPYQAQTLYGYGTRSEAAQYAVHLNCSFTAVTDEGLIYALDHLRDDGFVIGDELAYLRQNP